MYVLFILPHGGAGIPALSKLAQLKQEIESWSQRHNIRYTQKTVKYTHRLAFDKDEDYTVFAMTWSWQIPYQIVGVGATKY